MNESMNKGYVPPSASVEWETPQDLFDALNAEFGFTVDVASSEENAKVSKHYTRETNGLTQSWDGEVVWCNPPYGREIAQWMRKASQSAATSVLLVPSRTDVRWFHDYVYGKADIRFIKGRVKFGGAKDPAPFANMIVIFRNSKYVHEGNVAA